MKQEFSRSWVASKQPRKQRKYRANAPLHIKSKFMAAHLSSELRKKYGKRAIEVRKDDRVKIMRGQFKGISGKIERSNLKKTAIYMKGAEITKKDGSKAFYPLHPSNLMILELNLSDKNRLNSLNRGNK
jgi:large subunit ribosomal protein L24